MPDRLLAAALELVQAEGLPGLSQARVAAAAGLRQSHLTYYFPTRKDLLKAVVQAIRSGMIDALGASAPPGGRHATSLSEVRDFFAARARDPLLCRLMLALMNAADEDPSLRRWLGEFDDDMVGLLRRVLARAGLRPRRDELALLHASLVGAAILGTQKGDRASGDRSARLVRLAFDRMAAAPASARRSGAAARARLVR